MIRTANLTASVSRNAGGLFESVRRLVQSLIETGMEVRVFGTRDEFTDVDVKAWEPATVRAFQPSWPKKFGYSPHFLKELMDFRPDVTHTHGVWIYPSVAVNVYSRRSRTPYLISTHGMLDPWAIRNSRWKKVIAHFLYEGRHLRGAHCLRALCEAEARAMRQTGLTNEIAVIPNGIDLPNAASCSPPCWEGIVEPGTKIMLYLGRIHPKKGLANLLRGWQLASKDSAAAGGSWVLAIAGWDQGGHEAELKGLCTELGIPFTDLRSPPSGLRPPVSALCPPVSVLFLGPQFKQDRATCYHHCDAFILPSFSEGVPMVVLEAWANAKPVLMTPQCNLPEGFAAGAALKIEPCVESVANGLKTLWRMSGSDTRVLSQRGRLLAVERFVWPHIACQMKDVYQWMLGSGAKPSCFADF